MKKIKLCLTGGGTGGHIYPALSIYSYLKDAGMIKDVVYVGNKHKAEGLIVPKEGIPFQHVDSAPLSGVSVKKRLKTLFILIKGTLKALRFLISYRPRLIVATGGYVSAPIVFAAFALKPLFNMKIVLQEQNVVPGFFNKLASILANIVLVSFPESPFYLWSNRCVYTGYPFRNNYREKYQEEEIRKNLKIPEGCQVVLSYGGSLGAKTINDALPELLKILTRRDNVYWVHVTGMNKGVYSAFRSTEEKIKKIKDLQYDESTHEIIFKGEKRGKLLEYSHQLIDFQRIAHVIITRSGAGGVSEAAALGKAAIFIPKKGLSNDHQEINAFSLAEKGACYVVFEENEKKEAVISSAEALKYLVRLLDNSSERKQLENSIKKYYLPQYEKTTVETIQALLEDESIIEFTEPAILPKFVKYNISFNQLIKKIDLLSQENEKHFLIQYYEKKVESYLQSSRWETYNKGIKLAGALRNVEKLDEIAGNYNKLNGFQRRNFLMAISRLKEVSHNWYSLVCDSIDDRYYEARAESIRLVPLIFDKIGNKEEIKARLLARLNKRFERWEVKRTIIQTLPFLIDEDDFYKVTARYRTCRQVMIREALLESVYDGYNNGYLKCSEKLKKFIKGIFITTSHFSPIFSIRHKYNRLLTLLEESTQKDG